MKDALRKGRTCVPALVCAWCVACAPSRIQLQIEPEQPTSLLVGQVAAVQLSERQELAGSAGAALVLIERSNVRGTRTYLYRAERVGNQTLVVVPTNLSDGDCISCVTEHYFIRVIR
jgi:hypothetical protein